MEPATLTAVIERQPGVLDSAPGFDTRQSLLSQYPLTSRRRMGFKPTPSACIEN
jgi:hypothetical protein